VFFGRRLKSHRYAHTNFGASLMGSQLRQGLIVTQVPKRQHMRTGTQLLLDSKLKFKRYKFCGWFPPTCCIFPSALFGFCCCLLSNFNGLLALPLCNSSKSSPIVSRATKSYSKHTFINGCMYDRWHVCWRCERCCLAAMRACV
jgi:hypothetical protein